jgi:hypothetical protein
MSIAGLQAPAEPFCRGLLAKQEALHPVAAVPPQDSSWSSVSTPSAITVLPSRLANAITANTASSSASWPMPWTKVCRSWTRAGLVPNGTGGGREHGSGRRRRGCAANNEDVDALLEVRIEDRFSGHAPGDDMKSDGLGTFPESRHEDAQP